MPKKLIIAVLGLSLLPACVLPCKERRDRAWEMIEAAVSSNLSCTVDEDCTSVWIDTNCAGACPSAVAKIGRQAGIDAVERADRLYCVQFREDGCGYVTPGCIGTLVPTCDRGRCVMAPP